VPIVQPGAPGKPNKTLTPDTASAPQRAPSPADIRFMQDMIMHHNQAVEMTALLKTRSHNPEIQEIGRKISVSQSDEMRFMKQWLTERGQPLTAPMDMGGMDMGGMDMKGMDMSGMEHMHADPDKAMMPGMLTPRQMEALAKATGPEFDHLFLTGMIMHHTGAVNMVKDLFATPGAGQDPLLFDFANDVDNTQLAEIDIMKHMLKEKK
jgi:uncharacterized protein (DUF305 family)